MKKPTSPRPKPVPVLLLLSDDERAVVKRVGDTMFPAMPPDERLVAAYQYLFTLSVKAVRKVDEAAGAAGAPAALAL